MNSNWTRRDVVRSLSAFVAAPLIIPSRARGNRIAPSERITLGFIGMGAMNRDHLSKFLAHAGAQVVAVCDVDTTRRESARKMADDYYTANGGAAGCKAFNDHRELLALPDLNAVVIATPDHWHATIAIDACKAGKDVYCEKPLSLTLREAKLMIDAARKYERVFQTGSRQRSEYEGRFRKACEYVRNGRLGTLISVTVGIPESSRWCDLPEEPLEPGLDWDRWLGPAPARAYNSILSPRGVHTHYPAWRAYREYSGGYLADMGSHHLDIAQWALNMDASGPVKVTPPATSDKKYGARLTYPNGVELFHGGPSGTVFTGTRGILAVDRDRINTIPDAILKEDLKDEDERLPQTTSHHDNWLECVKSRAKPICDVEIGARSIACGHLLNLAYWHERSLTWDPAKWEFPGDAEANGWMDYSRREGYPLPEI
jgi:predicted dehydrogenase